MATIEINIDENILREAEMVLDSVGMDVHMAVSIFLRRVALEKGLPMSMTASSSNLKGRSVSVGNHVVSPKEPIYQTRNSNTTITRGMVDEVWQAFIRYSKGLGEIGRLSDDVADNSGMSRGSAFIYLNILANLIKGESNTRTLKMMDLEYLMEKIETDLGENECRNAIHSLEQSVPYWREKIPGAFADKVAALCKKYRLKYKMKE